MKRIIALTVAVVFLFVWGAVRSNDSDESGPRRVRWSEGDLLADPSANVESLARATVLRVEGDITVLVGNDVVDGSRRIAVVRGDVWLISHQSPTENGGGAGVEGISIEALEESIANVRVFRESGVTLEDVLVDPVRGGRWAVVIGEDVYGYHVLDAEGRVLRTSA